MACATCRRARRAKVAAARAATRTAAYLSRALGILCKAAVVTHAILALSVVAAISLLNHPITSRWIHATEKHLSTLSYYNTHTIFPWTAVLVLRCVVQILQVCVCCVVLYAKCACRRCRRLPFVSSTASTGRATRKASSGPPSAPPMCKPLKPLRQPGKPPRKRLYPNIPGYGHPK